MTTQLALFKEAGVKVGVVDEPTQVRVGSRVAQINLSKRRREALKRLGEVLDQLEGKDIYISSSGGAHSHFWINRLKLGRLRLEFSSYKYPTAPWKGDYTPSVIVLWGNRDSSVRIFTNQLVNVREQEYQGYTMWLLDFWNGFGEYPIDPYRPIGYTCLDIVRFKD